MANWTDKRLAKLKFLHKEGFSASAIAKRLGAAFSKSMVLRKLHALEAARTEAALRRAALKAARDRKLKQAARAAQAAKPTAAKPIILPTRPAPPSEQGLRIFDLREGHCRWPLGTERPARLFCGCTAVRGSSWCEEHERVYSRAATAAATRKLFRSIRTL